jgi:hypothetical protein
LVEILVVSCGERGDSSYVAGYFLRALDLMAIAAIGGQTVNTMRAKTKLRANIFFVSLVHLQDTRRIAPS